MNVVDSSGWLSYFAGEKNLHVFAEPIGRFEELLVPSITLTEVSRIILRQRGEETADRAVAHMLQGKVVPLNESLAVDAAYFGLEYKLPLADSIIYATAQKYEAVVWTQDADFRDLKNVRYYPK